MIPFITLQQPRLQTGRFMMMLMMGMEAGC